MTDTEHAVDQGDRDTAAPREHRPRRVIKRYSNRKLYDTKASSYVTLLNIADMVREGENVQVVDNATKEDKTDLTLALVISEELKARPREVPTATLKALLKSRGGRLVHQLREGPIGKFLADDQQEGESMQPEGSEEGRKGAPGLRSTLEQWQSTIDERIRAMIPRHTDFQALEQRVEDLNRRVTELEKRLGGTAH